MKTFLVPALLLSLVGVAAAIASGSAPSVPAAPAASSAGECHKVSTGISCPMSSVECDETMGATAGAKVCPSAAAERCSESAEKSECAEVCESEEPEQGCKEKKQCSPKSPEPSQKP